MSERRSLRFGLMCEGYQFPAWQAHCLELLLECPGVSPALLIFNEENGSGSSGPTRIRRLLRGQLGLWQVYSKLYVRSRALALRQVDLTPRLEQVPQLRCRVVRKGKYSEYFTDEDVARIGGFDLDFILRFSFGIIRGDILQAARYGVWSFHHGDEQRYRGGPPCFWEVDAGDPVTGAILQRLTDRLDGGIVLHKGFFRTSKTSYARNLDTAYFGGAAWPARVCRDILNGEAAYLEASASSTRAPIFYNPTSPRLAIFVAKLFWRWVAHKVRGILRQDQWNVGFVEEPIQSFLEEPKPAARWFPAPPRRSRFLADPFGCVVDGRLVVIAEDFDHRTSRGSIAVVERTGDGSVTAPRRVLDLDVHASYPFLVSWEGDWFCIPETHQAGEVTLYKAARFPDRWERVATLISGFPALDPTLFRHQDRWWLFCSRLETAYGFDGEDDDVKLYAWSADELAGPWRPHSANPLKTDVRSSRPAGTPFLHLGQLHRPAQDVSLSYGGRVVLNRVDRLTPTRFEEEVVGAVEPYAESRYRHGLHHLAAAGGMTLIDGKRSVFIPEVLRAKLARYLRRPRP